VLAYFRTPGLSLTGRLPFYLAVSLSAAVVIVVGILRYRPANWLPWALFAVSQLVYFAADCTFYTYHDILHDARYPAPADAIYLAHYPFLAAGLLILGGRRRHQRGALIDILIVGTAFALLAWILLMDPYTHETMGGLLFRLTSIAYPVMDLMVLFAALRLIGPSVRVPAMAYLTGSLVFLLFSDFAYAWLQMKGRYSGPGDFLDATWMTYYLLLGAAALSPSMSRLADATRASPAKLGGIRLALLTSAALAPPVASIVEHAAGKPEHDYSIAIASIVVFLLVVTRLAGVASAQRRVQVEKERLLGRVVDVAERERMRVAKDLTDGPIQKLTGLAMRLELLASQLIHGELDEASASIRRVRDELAGELDSLRRLIVNLRPPVLGDEGIARALADCAARVLHGDIAAHIESTVESPLAPQLETALYRIAREALLNVDTHAQARRVDVTLFERDDEIVLSIRDDGRGFDGSAYARNADGYPGLWSMQDLAQSLGGTLRVTSGRGAGTEVRAVMPRLEPAGYGSTLSQVTSAG